VRLQAAVRGHAVRYEQEEVRRLEWLKCAPPAARLPTLPQPRRPTQRHRTPPPHTHTRS